LSEADLEKRDLSKKIFAWKAVHFVGDAMKIPVTCVEYPPKSIQARRLVPGFAKSISRDMQVEMTGCKQILCVMFLTSSEDIKNFDVTFFTDSSNVPRHQQAQNMLASRPVYAITGGHSSLAQLIAHNKYPHNPVYKSLDVLLYVCHDTAENRELIRAIGARDNRHAHKIKKQSMSTKLHNLHRGLMDAIERTPVSEPGVGPRSAREHLCRLRKAELLKVGETFRGTYECNVQTYRQIKSVASKTGAVWDAISKIFLGDVKQRKGGGRIQVPVSCAHFIAMSGINEHNLIELLNGVVNGEYLTRDFLRLCKSAKAADRIRKHVLQLLKVKQEYSEDLWHKMQVLNPFTCSDEFVMRHIGIVKGLRMKQPLPRELSDAIFANMGKDAKAKKLLVRQQPAEQVQVSLIFVVCCDCFMFKILILIFHLEIGAVVRGRRRGVGRRWG
jgi:hypothetical protein